MTHLQNPVDEQNARAVAFFTRTNAQMNRIIAAFRPPLVDLIRTEIAAFRGEFDNAHRTLNRLIYESDERKHQARQVEGLLVRVLGICQRVDIAGYAIHTQTAAPFVVCRLFSVFDHPETEEPTRWILIQHEDGEDEVIGKLYGLIREIDEDKTAQSFRVDGKTCF